MTLRTACVLTFGMGIAGAGCRPAPSVHELPTSHLSTNLQAEALKPPERRHHMAWNSAESTSDPRLQPPPADRAIQTAAVSRRSHRPPLPDAPVTMVPPSPERPAGTAPDPWAPFRPRTSTSWPGAF